MKIENDGIITLSNSAVECKISLWGGNIISYRPKSQQHDVFWLGEKNKFDNIQAIRGGIPVCWPRFAEEKLNNHFPRHGFARLSMWNLKKAIIDEQKIEAELFLIPDNKYNTKVIANLLFKITDKLECTLTTLNYGDDEFCFSEALHAYFNVSNKDEILIKGLSGQQYKSSLDNKIYTLNNDLQLDGEFDGAFLNHTKNIEIIDAREKIETVSGVRVPLIKNTGTFWNKAVIVPLIKRSGERFYSQFSSEMIKLRQKIKAGYHRY